MNYTYKQIWFINLPIMVSLLMEQLINLTDSIFLGRVSQIDLGASALAAMYYSAIYMLGFGFSLGAQVVIARRNGEERYAEVGRVFYQALIFLSLFSIVVFALSKLFSPALLRLLITSDNVYQATVRYIEWRDYSFLFAFPLLAIRAFFIGTTYTKILTANSIVMVVCNIVFNYLLIFGKAGFPRLEISGAAIASSLAGLIGLVFLLIYMWKYVDKKRYGIRAVFDLKLSLHLLSISVWTMIRQFFCIAPWFLFFVAIEHLGECELASANVVRSISMLFFVIVSSFATTTISLVSNLIGAKKSEQVMQTCRRVINLDYAIGIPLLLLAFIFSDSLLGLFTNDIAVIQTAFYPFCVMLSTFIISVPAYTYCNTMIGTGNTKIAFLFQMINITVYLLYLFILSRSPNIPLAVYWTAEQLYVLVLLLLSLAYLRRNSSFLIRF
ncbi:putative MATE family efflux protein [Parabacteroides sp. PF5-5]|uniref:MATE family efflux transporter n=1 Tax=unclassified Parabacteroides TaxID=2649774 RepID=UPI0024771CC9|nr:MULTISPECIES: MATE family efflux transporter [unclassified Parabacteroides]MDH6306500.1 putative MATE family efflux protein [Parabacteroides sp. PH5-39]MDH6317467.1 putative MATE family efflux protein [Parabacteroides sp. PF5-13]MDH6321230.1 putative MATE family efflux protein [Parabacteroides sp. PH5-13]MDH6324962.1 putative MATE family efflux protein [Parabacteroides sp. PH5-8]MDH6328671.1 putative MATE family efflux protein [Parabacteroides sp. PH5-41]